MIRRPCIWIAALILSGCGSGSVAISHEEFIGLPREYRQEIFDAENDLVIARNREGDARDKQGTAQQALSDLYARWDRTAKALSTAGQAAKVSGARKVFDMNVAYVASQVDVAAAVIRTAEAGTRLSRARLDLVKERQLARIGRAALGSIKPLEDKVLAAEQQLKATAAAEVDLRTRVQKQLNAWKLAEDAYVASSGDYDTGVWGE
jgi:hypothetical protein